MMVGEPASASGAGRFALDLAGNVEEVARVEADIEGIGLIVGNDLLLGRPRWDC